MGTKGGKPVSTLEKRQQKLAKEKEKAVKTVKEVKKEVSVSTLSEEMVLKVANDIRSMDLITPHIVAQKFDIKLSTAKKILRELAKRDAIDVVLKNRRVIIAKPKT